MARASPFFYKIPVDILMRTGVHIPKTGSFFEMSNIDDICNDLRAAVEGNQYNNGMLAQLAGAAFSGEQILPIQRDLEAVLHSSGALASGRFGGGYDEMHCNGDDAGVKAIATQMRDQAVEVAIANIRNLPQPAACLG
jgi:hypothetical protein